jgi:phosphatidylethanolamine-binding protein (PEBP) family uncharacterized protein
MIKRAAAGALLILMYVGAAAAPPAFTLTSPDPDEGDPPHHYTITIYALSVDHLNVPETATPADIDSEVASKTIGKAQLVRLFSRPKKTEQPLGSIDNKLDFTL